MNVEQEEAKKIVDKLAREIHGIYGQHATEAGFKTPKWEELPDPAKGISLDMARFTLTKMQEAYSEGLKVAGEKKHVPETPTASPSRSWSPADISKLTEDLVPRLKGLIEHVESAKRGPVGTGLDRAVAKLVESLALTVIQETPEMLSKIRGIVESQLNQFLAIDTDGEEKEEE